MVSKALEEQKIIDDAKRGVLSKFPLLGSVVSGVVFREVGDALPTAATDGEKIVYNGEFVASLSYEERVGVFAHEIMHIAFNHILRSKDKDGRIWNIATDSVINQMLRDEGVKLPDGTVDMPEAQNRSAEDMYDKILEEIKKRQQEQDPSAQGDTQGENSQNAQSGDANAQSGAQTSLQDGAQSGSQNNGNEAQNGDSQSGNSNDSGALQKGSEQGENLQDQNSCSQGAGGQFPKDNSQNNNNDNGTQNGNLQGNNSQNGVQNSNDQNNGSQGNMSSQKPQGDKSLAQGQNQNKDDNFDLDKVLGGKAFDSHDIWQDAVKKAERRAHAEQDEHNEQGISEKDKSNKIAEQQSEDTIQDFEREFVEQNRKKKEQIARKIIDDLNNKRPDACDVGTQTYSLGAVGKAKATVSWKKLLKKELDKEDDRWSYRRASDENDYQARIGYVQIEDKPKTEVILDVSGSVSAGLLREFLRQIKPLVDDGELKVGTFSDEFWGWQKVKSKKEIDEIAFHIGGTTNYDAASRAFSKERGTNHIVFTDGDYGKHIVEKRNDTIWISFKNPEFKPDFGRVIYVSPEEIMENDSSRNGEFTR